MIKYYLKKRRNPQDATFGIYATACTPNAVKLDQIATDISQACTVTESDVKGVLNALQRWIINNIQNSKSVRMGDLGSFSFSFHSKGVTDVAKVTTALIQEIHVRFRKSAFLKHHINLSNTDVHFTRAKDKQGNPLAKA